MSEPSTGEPAFVESTEPVYSSFLSGVALTFGTRLLMLVGVFGSGVIVARWLGAEAFGVYAVLNVTVALAVQIGSAGLPSANTFFIARDRKALAPIWAIALNFAPAAGGFLALALLVAAVFRPSLFGVSPIFLVVAAAAIPFQLLFLLGLNVLLAIDRIRQLNLFDALLPAWVFVNAVVAVIVLRAQLLALVTLNTAVAIALSVLVALYIARQISKQGQSRRDEYDVQLLKTMLAYGIKFYISILAGAIIFRADLLIVNRFRGAGEAGVYAVATQFSLLLLMLPGVIATLLFPRVASSQDQRGEFAVQVTRHTTVVMLVTCLAAAAFSFVLPFIYGPEFVDATTQLLILLPGVFLVGLESVLVQHFTGTGLPPAIPVFWLITVAFNIGLNLLVVPVYGARGAAATSTLSYALIFILVAIYFCMKTRRRPAEIFLLRNRELRTLFSPGRWSGSPTKASQ